MRFFLKKTQKLLGKNLRILVTTFKIMSIESRINVFNVRESRKMYLIYMKFDKYYKNIFFVGLGMYFLIMHLKKQNFKDNLNG